MAMGVWCDAGFGSAYDAVEWYMQDRCYNLVECSASLSYYVNGMPSFLLKEQGLDTRRYLWLDVRTFLPQLKNETKPQGWGLNFNVAYHVLHRCKRPPDA